ncbi:MAG TPA: PKD domain-containing protein, partial [Anaeromyxobacteraceae bacterium]|nr:PKD domain-containing protein [Anaeromyxobacteraceae bacterium]
PCAAFQWSLGDGAEASGAGPFVHRYAFRGRYRVTLTVTDAAGRSARRVRRVGPQKPWPTGSGVDGTPLAGAAPLTIRLDGTSCAAAMDALRMRIVDVANSVVRWGGVRGAFSVSRRLGSLAH